jgi:hypothetical protein
LRDRCGPPGAPRDSHGLSLLTGDADHSFRFDGDHYSECPPAHAKPPPGFTDPAAVLLCVTCLRTSRLVVAQKLARFSLTSPFERGTSRQSRRPNSAWMIEHRCPGPTSGLVEMLLLAAISVDRLSQLPQVNVACLSGRRTHDCLRLKRWLQRPPVMGCGHGRQRKCKFFHRSAPPSRKTMTKKKGSAREFVEVHAN